MRKCVCCGEKINSGFWIDGTSRPTTVCDDCFDDYMDKRFGRSLWRKSPEAEEGRMNDACGYYDVFNRETKEWEPWNIYAVDSWEGDEEEDWVEYETMEVISCNEYMSKNTKYVGGFYIGKYCGKLIVSDSYNGADDPLFWVELKDPEGYGDESEWALINEYIDETFPDYDEEFYDDKWDNYWADVKKSLGLH